MASYAEPADLVKRFDAREVAQLASDTGEPVGSVTLDPVVLLALEDASGDIDSALLAAGRYTADDLEGLEGNSLALLKRMTCELAMVYLMERRPDLSEEQTRRHEAIRKRHLEPLRQGVNVFGLEATVEAGQPSVEGPTVQEVAQLNLIKTHSEGRYYPRRRFPY